MPPTEAMQERGLSWGHTLLAFLARAPVVHGCRAALCRKWRLSVLESTNLLREGNLKSGSLEKNRGASARPKTLLSTANWVEVTEYYVLAPCRRHVRCFPYFAGGG